MADISKITLPNGSSYDFKDATARSGLAGKAASSHTHTKSQITDFPTIPTKTSQLTNDSGFKTTDNNTTYSLSKSGSTITLTGSDGSTTSVTDNNTTYSTMTGATSSAAGKAGLVPAPATGAANRYLRSDGTWQVPPDNNTTYGVVSKTANGLAPKLPDETTTTKYLRQDGTWVVPPNTVYTHPTTSGNKHIPSGGSSGQILRWSADGTAVWGNDNNTTYGVATSSALGLVKSGTDITVDSSGNVSVNDDSHNHVISNVDGLQSALDGKASSSHTHNYAGSSSAGGSANSLSYFKNTSAIDVGIDDTSANAVGYVSGTGSILDQKDGAMYKQVYSGSWVHEIYGDYRTGQLAVRGKNNGAWQPWRKILDSTNYTSYCTPANIGAAASSHTHSSYVNQNAFSNITVGSTTVSADSATDTLTLVAGSNITITPDATNDKITIASTNTWRGIQNNLKSDSTTDSLSAAQGKVLKNLVDNKAALSHIHTKSQITDFPSSLPANGGNADTVGEKLPEKIFYDNGISSDLDSATKSGCYAASPDTLNVPSSSWWVVDTMNFDNQFIVQKAHAIGNTAVTVSYIRNYANNVWSDWTEMYTSGNKPYVTGTAPVEANTMVCVTNHGFMPSAAIWWNQSKSGIATSFTTTSIATGWVTSNKTTLNYMIFK